MHSLALALQQLGHEVSGSDDVIAEPSRSALQAHGLLPEREGWFAERIHRGLDAVIVGMHARNDNPELLQARALQLPVYSFPQFLYEHARQKQRLVVAGSHGKTTITAMVMHVFRKKQLAFDYLIGSAVPGFSASVRLSHDAGWMIFEGDEYPDSALSLQPKFIVYRPHVALISGLAWDHINVFPTRVAYRQAFADLLAILPEGAPLVFNADDDVLADLVHASAKHLQAIPYTTPLFRKEPSGWQLFYDGCAYATRLIGQHNMQNLMGAALLCRHAAGIPVEEALQAAGDFAGANRRLQLVAEGRRCIVYHDFAHAPSKVRATVQAVKEHYADRHLLACLELHTFSSVDEHYIDEYRDSLAAADAAVVFYDEDTLARKGRGTLAPDRIRRAFAREDLPVFTSREALEAFLMQYPWQHHVLLLMSSGHWGGMDVGGLAKFVALP